MNVSLFNPKHISFPFIIISIPFFLSLFLSLFSCIFPSNKHIPPTKVFSIPRFSYSSSFTIIDIQNGKRGMRMKEKNRSRQWKFFFSIPWILCIQPEFFFFIAVDVKNDLPLISSLTGKFNFFSYFLSIAFKNCWYHFSLSIILMRM